MQYQPFTSNGNEIGRVYMWQGTSPPADLSLLGIYDDDLPLISNLCILVFACGCWWQLDGCPKKCAEAKWKKCNCDCGGTAAPETPTLTATGVLVGTVVTGPGTGTIVNEAEVQITAEYNTDCSEITYTYEVTNGQTGTAMPITTATAVDDGNGNGTVPITQATLDEFVATGGDVNEDITIWIATTATDNCGNSAISSQIINLTTGEVTALPPACDCLIVSQQPGNAITTGVDGGAYLPQPTTATLEDNGDGTWTVTDADGNVTTVNAGDGDDLLNVIQNLQSVATTPTCYTAETKCEIIYVDADGCVHRHQKARITDGFRTPNAAHGHTFTDADGDGIDGLVDSGGVWNIALDCPSRIRIRGAQQYINSGIKVGLTPAHLMWAWFDVGGTLYEANNGFVVNRMESGEENEVALSVLTPVLPAGVYPIKYLVGVRLNPLLADERIYGSNYHFVVEWDAPV